MKYIDAEKLIVLIDAKLEDLGLSGSVWVGRSVLQELKNDIITSLQQEQPKMDFEKELKNERTKLLDAFGSMNGEQCLAIRNFARHFYELDKTVIREY